MADTVEAEQNTRVSKSRSYHQSIAHRNHNRKSDNRGGDTSGEEVLDLQISHARLGDFHHDGSCRGNISITAKKYSARTDYRGEQTRSRDPTHSYLETPRSATPSQPNTSTPPP